MTGGRSAPWRASEVWTWDPAKIAYERDVDGLRELVWLNPRKPPAAVRDRLRLRVEIACPFEEIELLNAGLRVLERQFRDDSWLAAIVRSPESNRMVFYTDAPEPTLHERCIVLRAVLRPETISMLIVADPSWSRVEALEAEARSRSAR